MLDGLYEQKRWFYTDGPYDESVTYTDAEVLDGTYVIKVITADSPDEELQLSVVIIPIECSMELV